MSKMLPNEYEKRSTGVGCSVFFFIFAAVVSFLMIKAGMDWNISIVFFIGAAVLSALFILSDITTNKKNAEKINYMNYMLSQPYVWGEYKGCKKYMYILGHYKDITDKPTTAHHYGFKIIVEINHPESDEKITVLSEMYPRNPEREWKLDKIKVHYSPDGKYWIDVVS